MKVCAEPGCPAIQREPRCATHRREREQARGSRQARGYNATHTALRASYAARMAHGETFDCWRCGKPLNPADWQLGHDDADRSRYRGPECIPCNTATAGRISPVT